MYSCLLGHMYIIIIITVEASKSFVGCKAFNAEIHCLASLVIVLLVLIVVL